MITIVVVILSILHVGLAQPDPVTPLQNFINEPNPEFTWSLNSIIRGSDWDTYIVNLTSGAWLTPQDSNAYIWRHWISIAVPHKLQNPEYALIYADGGDTTDAAPTTADAIAGIFANKTGCIVAHLFQIPDEPIYFTAENPPHRRTEDAIIAYTWMHYMNYTNEPNWILRLPMVRAVVTCMDAIQEFTTSVNFPKPTKFAIGGASKRGWTTWLTPVVDKRVVAIVPIVMPIPNMVSVINKMWRSLGEWSFALQDYEAVDVMSRINTPQFQQLANIIDPITYLNSISNVPKYLVCSCGDEFFLPDSPREGWKYFKGNKQIRMVPNAEHSLAGQTYQILNQIADWFWMFMNDDLPESLDYQLVYSNTTASISVNPSRTPASVTLWRASTLSYERRDFRLVICGDLNNPACFQPVIWYPTSIAPNADGIYSVSVDAPAGGWTGFLLEVQYASTKDPNRYFEATSEVNIVPDRYPFAPCSTCGN